MTAPGLAPARFSAPSGTEVPGGADFRTGGLPTGSPIAAAAPAAGGLPDLAGTPWRRIWLSERRGIWCLVDAVDYDWLMAWRWNWAFHRNTPWKHYAKRNVGPARSTVYMHREILLRALPDQLEQAASHHGDHANGQSLDNRRDNLRWLMPADNARWRLRRGTAPPLEQIVGELLATWRPAPTDEIPF